MARPLRIHYSGAYYHVMNRGNRREDIFVNVQVEELRDRKTKLKILRQKAMERS